VRPFARTHPRRISAGRASAPVFQTGARAKSVTRVPGTSRGGFARHRQERAHHLLSSVPARGSFFHASGLRCAKAAANEPWLAGLHQGNLATGRRNRHRLVPACSGAKAPLACEGQQLEGCARASTTVAEVDERRRGSDKRDFPMANGSRGREPRLDGIRKDEVELQTRRRPRPRWPSRSVGRGPSRASERALRGRGLRSMEGIPDRRPEQLVHASGSKAIWRLTRHGQARERLPVFARGDRDVRGLCMHASRREDNARHRRSREGSRAARRSEWL